MTTPGLQVDQVAPAFVSVPGVTVEMLRKVPGGTYNTTSATFVSINAAMDGSFVAPVSGIYLISFTVQAYAVSASAHARYRLNIDSGSTIVGTDDATWQQQLNTSSHEGRTFVTSVTLTAGSHTISPEWRRVAGSGTAQVDTDDSVVVQGTLVSGSGVGGNLVAYKAKTADQGSIPATTWTAITELSHTFTVANNENLRIHYNILGYSSSAASPALGYRLDGGSWQPLAAESTSATYWVTFGGSLPLQNLAAGSHTVDFGWYANVGTSTVIGSSSYGGLTWTSFACLWQDRGGLVTPDTKLAQLTYSAAGAINVAAALGQPSTVQLTLQDGKQRYFSGTLAWAFANGVADLGLDEGSEASSTWYYMYAVPKSGDDSQLSVRASDNDPSVGPTGYTNFKFLGAFRNNSSSDIIKFYQSGNVFEYATTTVPLDFTSSGSADGAIQTLTLTNFVPATALQADILGYYQCNGTGTMFLFSYGDEDITSATTRWNTAKLKCSSPNTNGGHSHRGLIPTPEATKRITYIRDIFLNSRIECQGWVDGYLL
jgi:hypothetical protein